MLFVLLLSIISASLLPIFAKNSLNSFAIFFLSVISIPLTLNDLGKSCCLRFVLISYLMVSHVLRVFVLNVSNIVA